MKIIFPILFLVFFSKQSLCQIYLGIGVSYPFCLSPKSLIYDQNQINDSIDYISTTAKDNFTNINVPIFLEVKIHKNISLNLEYKYLTNNYSVIYSRSSFGYNELSESFKLHNLSLQILTHKSFSKSSVLSFGFGITTLFAGNYVKSSKTVASFPSDTTTFRYFNGTNLGIKSSISYENNVFKRMYLFASLNCELASWRPKNYELTKLISRGVDKLPTLPSNFIRGELRDECDNNNINSENGCKLQKFVDFEQISLAIGIKYKIL